MRLGEDFSVRPAGDVEGLGGGGLFCGANAFELTRPEVFQNEVIALVDIGFKSSSISILANGDGVNLTFDSNFGQPFLNRNGQALGAHMDSALIEGDSAGIGRLMALLGNLKVGDEALYSQIFTELNDDYRRANLRAFRLIATTVCLKCSPGSMTAVSTVTPAWALACRW